MLPIAYVNRESVTILTEDLAPGVHIAIALSFFQEGFPCDASSV
jgi:hypothetical protein